VRLSIQRPALVRVRLQLVEDGGKDCPVIGCFGDRIGDEIAGDPDLGSPARRQMGDDEGDQHQRPQHDEKRKTAAAAPH